MSNTNRLTLADSASAGSDKKDLETGRIMGTTTTASLEFANVEKTATRLTVLGEGGGTVRNYNLQGDQLLIPSPSDDANDPLNWSQARKWYLTCLVCAAVFCANLCSAGPSIALLTTSMDFKTDVSKTSYLFTTALLVQGISMLCWAPLIAKFGRRPIYVGSFVIYTAFIFGAGACNSWGSQLACRLIFAWFSGAGEILGPLTIKDLWFVHERSVPMGLFNAFLSLGVGLAMVMDGWVSQGAGWRSIYWVSGGIVALVTLLVIFSFPETMYARGAQRTVTVHEPRTIDHSQRHTYMQQLSVMPSRIWTKDPWGMLILRPLVLITFPAVLWTAFIFAVTIGALVAISSNVAVAYGMTYFWGNGLTGSAFVSACIGSILGVIGAGLAEKWSARLTRNNGGVREPEMRLLPMIPALFTTPGALILYGVGIQNRLHWIVPTIGLGLLNFSIVWATTIALVYMVDVLKPLAEESITSVLVFKAIIGFILSFYTNPWIDHQGYLNAMGEFSGICVFFLLWVFVFMIWGKKIRTAALRWTLMDKIRWHQDRDDVIIEDE